MAGLRWLSRNSKFLHAATEGVGMNAENLGSSLGSLDYAVSLGQYGQDVALDYVVQRRACRSEERRVGKECQ